MRDGVEITSRKSGDFDWLGIAGEVDMHASPQVRKALLDALQPKSALLVDLSAVRYMDSSGVACLVEAFQTARKQGSSFALVAVAQPVLNVLRLARLDKVFTLYASLDEALAGGS